MAATSSSVAVVIPTKNRPEDLAATVESVLKQTVLPAQMIIVDQSSAAASEEQIRRLLRGHALDSSVIMQLTYVRDEQLPGLTAARNCGLDFVTADVVLFLDDDVLLERGFIADILRVYAAKPEATGVSGIITNYSRPALGVYLWTFLFMRGPFKDDRQPIYWRAELLKGIAPVRVSRLGGGLMSFRLSKLGSIRFDENLRGACAGEDVEFCSRLPVGTTLWISPNARLAHKRSCVSRSKEHWLVRHASTMWYLYRRNWRHGLRNRVSFLWLNVGYLLIAAGLSLYHRSLRLWPALVCSVRGA